jgi:hypothetical protein
MALTPAQLVILKADILADSTLSSKPMNDDGHQAIADAYKALASPAFTVWKTSVPITQVGDKFNGAELAGLTTGNQGRLQTIAMYSAAGVNPSLADRRAFFDDVFSGAGGATTRANLLALWKRLALRGEKLFATGTGSDASPATLVVEGAISRQDVATARELP